jgi:hypothetical protein
MSWSHFVIGLRVVPGAPGQAAWMSAVKIGGMMHLENSKKDAKECKSVQPELQASGEQ